MLLQSTFSHLIMFSTNGESIYSQWYCFGAPSSINQILKSLCSRCAKGFDGTEPGSKGEEFLLAAGSGRVKLVWHLGHPCSRYKSAKSSVYDQMITLLHYYTGVVWQMIMVYHDSGGSTQGISSLQIWQKWNRFFAWRECLFRIIFWAYVKMITILHRGDRAKTVTMIP